MAKSKPISRVFALTFTLAESDATRVTNALFAAGAGGVEEQSPSRSIVYTDDPAAARRFISAAREGARSEVRVDVKELDPSWQSDWLRYLRPEPITPRWVLQPTSIRSPAPRGKRRLWYEPDAAFGVGSHPTTRLAARAVEACCSRLRPPSLLDVGTGNGVLALLGVVSGAKRALGIDIDPIAVRAARINARANGLGSRCRFSERGLDELTSRHPVVVANIEVWVLLDLAAELARVTAPAGRLLLTGFLQERAREVRGAFERLGFTAGRPRRQGEWGLLELARGVARL